MRSTLKTITATALAALLLASCASYHERQGNMAMAMLSYSKAEKHFNKALKHAQSRDLLLQAARAEACQNKVEQAAAHYAEAEATAPLSGKDAYEYGRLLMAMGNYREAESMLGRAWEGQAQRRDIADLIGSSQGYRSFYADSAQYEVRPLHIEGITSAYSAVPFADGLLFTAQREAATSRRDPWTGHSFSDLYTVRLEGDTAAAPPALLKGAVNGPFHEGPAVLGNDGRTLYFTRSNYYGRKLLKDPQNVSNLKLFRATLQPDGTWGQISEFAYNSDSYSVGQPALSRDEKTLFFASDMPGGQGGKDIWSCKDIGAGWGPPQNQGPTVNTPGDELFPTAIGDALYFSSTGHENMGGLDIFETHREGEFWSEPANMGYPINTSRDDFGLWLDGTGTRGYLSSSRSGADQIYALALRPPTFTLEGTIANGETGGSQPFAYITLQNLADLANLQDTADAHGKFKFELEPNRVYFLRAHAKGMLARSIMLSTAGLGKSTVLRADLRLEPMVIDKPIVVPNIYYDYDKWDIRPDAAVELNKLAQVFLDNPDLTFELGSHTDSRGSDMYNLLLSDARATSAVDYLVRQGVPQERLIARGYGETMLVNHCANGVSCTEEEHQANRRTEFKVIRDAQAEMQP